MTSRVYYNGAAVVQRAASIEPVSDVICHIHMKSRHRKIDYLNAIDGRTVLFFATAAVWEPKFALT